MSEGEENTVLLYRLKALETIVKEQAVKLHTLEIEIETRDRQRDDAEKKQLKAGIMALGAVIMTLVGVIWTYRDTIFRGTQ